MTAVITTLFKTSVFFFFTGAHALDITLSSDAVMYLGDVSTVTQSCDVIDATSLTASSVAFDMFTASSGTSFYGQ